MLSQGDIITIIVMLILAEIIIRIATQGNLFNYAKQAEGKTEIAKEKEKISLAISEVNIKKNGQISAGFIAEELEETLKGYDEGVNIETTGAPSKDDVSGGEDYAKITFSSGRIYYVRLTPGGTDNVGTVYEDEANSSATTTQSADEIAPAVSITETTTQSITFKGTDNKGIVAYAIIEEEGEPAEDDWKTVTSSKEFDHREERLTNNATYYVWVKDAAGNTNYTYAVTIDFEELEYDISWKGTTATITITSSSTYAQYRIGSEGDFIPYTGAFTAESGKTVQIKITDGVNTIETENIQVLATLTVSYNANGGTGSVPQVGQYQHTATVNVSFSPKPTKPGYVFQGWAQDSEATSAEYEEGFTTSFTMPKNLVALYAIWKEETPEYSATLLTGTGGVLEANAKYIDRTNPSKPKTAIIPKGFKVSTVPGENTIDGGLVIQDAIGNEFVWIPVDSAEIETVDSNGLNWIFKATFHRINSSDKDYEEPYSEGYDEEKNEYYDMMRSVQKYYGFYIGRFEAGILPDETNSNYRDSEIDNSNPDVVVQRDCFPYNYVPWGKDSQTYDEDVKINAYDEEVDENATNQGKGAVFLSKTFYEDTDDVGVTSTLCYGVQWDFMLRFIEYYGDSDLTSWANVNGNTFTIDRSTAQYCYNNECEWHKISEEGSVERFEWIPCVYLYTTGAHDDYAVKNIFDIGGNCSEWTMEAKTDGRRVTRRMPLAWGRFR